MRTKDPVEPAPLSRNPHLELLLAMPLFAHLDGTVLLDLLRRMVLKRWYADAIIAGQDEPGDALYILVSGRARAVLFGENGREMTLASLSRGDYFGETALLDDKPHPAHVVAEGEVALLSLGRQAFRDHLLAHPQTALHMLREMAGKLRAANSLVESLALMDVPARLTRTLVALAEQEGEPFGDGLLIRKRPTQQALANMVGTCRETVSRTLSALARQGMVVTRGRSLVLRGPLLNGLAQAA